MRELASSGDLDKAINGLKIKEKDQNLNIEDLIAQGCGKVSNNKARDICKFYLNGTSPSGHSIYLEFDGPNEEHKESWNSVISLDEDIVGKYILFVSKGISLDDSADDEFTEDLLRPGIFKSA